MKQRRINATLKRALPPIAALVLTTLLLILTILPLAGAVAPCCGISVNESKANKRIRLGSETAAAHSFIRSPFVDSTPGATTRISAAPRLERQPLESQTALNSTDLEAEAAATERGAPLSAFGVPSAASVVQSPGTTTHVSAALRSSPVMFIENVGQFDPSTGSGQGERARFQVRGGMGTMWLAEDAIWVTVLEKPSSPQPPSPNLGEGGAFLPSPEFGRGAGGEGHEGQPRKGVNLRLTFPGANPHPRIEPFDRLDTVVSYFIGNDPDQWHPDVPVWGGVRYVDIYPGVDLEVSSASGNWTWRLVFHNPQSEINIPEVRLRVDGAEALALDGDRMRLTTDVGDFTLPLLVIEGAMPDGQPVSFNVEPGTFEVSSPFSLSPVPLAPLSPQDNPDDLLYSTFLGGSDDDRGYAIAVDGAGSAYVTGETASSTFPTTAGAFDTGFNGFRDAFVVKLNAAGTALAYATFLGGSDSSDEGYAIAVDGAGSAYVTGVTYSADFPATEGAFNTTNNGDAFVVKLNAAGTGLTYGAFLGGSDLDEGYAIAVDRAGNAYVTGCTLSADFPTTAGALDTSYNGVWDAFVVKLNAAGTGLGYAAFLGGSDSDGGFAIAVDGAGHAYVTGVTESADFPTTAEAFDTSHNGYRDTFVVKVNAGGTELAYAAFLGGSEWDWGFAIAVDGAGSAYVTGYTNSSDFPTTAGAFDTSYNGGNFDAFVVKVNAVGTALVYAAFLGGIDWDEGDAIAVDGVGSAYVTGYTSSSDFPTTAGTFDTSHNGHTDAFVVKLNAAGTALAYATFLGGSSYDEGYGIAVGGAGSAYVMGETESADFPTTAGAFDTSYNGGTYGYDAFVAKLAVGGGPEPTSGTTTRVSVASDGTEGNGWSQHPAISADGRYVAFRSEASSLVPGDTNGFQDVFIHDLQSGTTTRVSVATDTSQGDGGSHSPAISADGRYVAFVSDASNLVPGDTNGYWDVFVHDWQTGTTTRVSVASDGSQGNGPWSTEPAISADGRYVAFNSDASNLVSGDTNGFQDVFIHDRQSGTTTRVSVASDGSQGNGWSVEPEISVDGRYVAFHSVASNLVPGDTNGYWDVFVHDRQTGVTTRVSVASDGSQGNSHSNGQVISADGRYVAFDSEASNLVPGDTNGWADVFVHDRQTGATTRVSIASDGSQGDCFSGGPAISADGRYAAFVSAASNLVPGDTNGKRDIFVHDRQTGVTARVSVASDGSQGNGDSEWPAISGDSHYVAFHSVASNLVPGDTNGYWDVFVHDLGEPGPTPGENPPTTPAPPPSTPTDEMFDGTDPTESYKYADQGPIEIDIVIDRYYGPNNNGTLDPPYIGKSVSEYSWLTIQAFDVDPDEVDRVFVNDHEVGRLTGVDGGWRPDSFPIPTDWLHFPDLSSGANPPDTTHAHNTIRIEIDEGGQGWATQVAWARFMVPGTRPVLLVHGLDIVREILCRSPFCDLTPYHNGWNPWQNWVNTDGSKGFLAEYRFPNVQSTTENGTQGPSTGEAESDVRAYTDGLKSYKDNSADIIAHILKVKNRYGVDKVNLVGHSKGGVDVRATWKRLQSMGLEDVVENAIVLGTPNEGIEEALVGWLASLFQSDVLYELSPVGMFRFNTSEGHGTYDQHSLYTVAGNKPNLLSFGYLEHWLQPNDGWILVSSVHGDLSPFPPDYIRTETLATDHSGLHNEEFVFNKVRPWLQPTGFDGAGAMSYATRQVGPRKEVPVRPISSVAAGNPVQYPSPIVGTISSGEVQTHTIAIDGDAASVSLMWGYADSMGLTLYDPQGQEIDPSASAAITYTASITDKTVGYVLEDPEAGQWTAQITATNTYTDGEEYLLVTAVSSTITVTAEVDKDWYAVNEPVQISAALRHGSAPITGAVVTATVFFSGTTAATTNLYDDGLHSDGAADDGWYTNTFTDTSQIGYYLILISAEGTSSGTAFSRVTSTQAAVASTGASLNDSYAEGLFDTDGDGLYNTLVITTGVSVTDTAGYRLVGMLTDTEGNYVVDAATEITLTVGVTDIPLLFNGETIAQSGRDGPYQLRNLALLDLSSATPVQADYRALAYTTGAYAYSQFQRDPIIVSTYATDQGVDTNDNGKHDLLRINASVDVRYAGTYTVTARLFDADWQDVASVYTTTDLVTGTNAISLDFNGAAISASGRNGPYRVGDVVIIYGFDPVTYLLISDFYTTQAYNYTDFDVAILQVSPVALTFYAQEGGANPPPNSVSIANTGGGLLDWTAAKNADWLSTNPTSGTVPISMSVSVDVTGLVADIYTGTITVTATISGTQSSPQEVTAKLCNLLGDLSCDCVVNVVDIMQVAAKWRCRSGDECYDENYDLDKDGDIDIVDIMLVAIHWGESCEG